MKHAAALAILMAGGLIAAAGLAQPVSYGGVANPARAHQNWMLKCQGCHRPDASGSPATAPAMAGEVANFLNVPGGREYLARVPGVATSALPDDQLAELLNWTLQRFDPRHVPKDFKPYTGEEIGRLRSKPLRTEAATARAGLMARLNANGGAAPLN